jgi:organic radical activating enzyme
MHTINYCEFYITNVCNLNCTDCNRYNSYAFTGHQRWNDHADTYEKWSKILNISNEIAILGGEPLLVPDFLDWMHGIAKLWPNNSIRIITNGTQLHRWPTLYQELLKYCGRIYLEINEHNENHASTTKNNIVNFLSGTVTTPTKIFNNTKWQQVYQQMRDESWPDCNSYDDYQQLPDAIKSECQNLHHIDIDTFYTDCGPVIVKSSTGTTYLDIDGTQVINNTTNYVDSNNIRVAFNPAWMFCNAPAVYNTSINKFQLPNSNPNKALKQCGMTLCHQLIRGRLYKCPPVGVLPEFIKQFTVELTVNDHNLINSYSGASPEWPDDQLTAFIKNLTDEKVIDHCKFCPENYVFKKFSASTKKIKIQKLKN